MNPSLPLMYSAALAALMIILFFLFQIGKGLGFIPVLSGEKSHPPEAERTNWVTIGIVILIIILALLACPTLLK